MSREAHAYLLDPRFIGKEMDPETREKIEHFVGFTYPYKANEDIFELSASAELYEWLDQMEAVHNNPEKRKSLDMLFHGEISQTSPRDRTHGILFIMHISGLRNSLLNHGFHP